MEKKTTETGMAMPIEDFNEMMIFSSRLILDSRELNPGDVAMDYPTVRAVVKEVMSVAELLEECGASREYFEKYQISGTWFAYRNSVYPGPAVEELYSEYLERLSGNPEWFEELGVHSFTPPLTRSPVFHNPGGMKELASLWDPSWHAYLKWECFGCGACNLPKSYHQPET